MTAGPSRRLQVPDSQPLRVVWRGVGGLVAAIGLLGLPPASSGDEGVGLAPQHDRAMVVRIPGARVDSDAEGVQAPPRPPVTEQAERKGWQPGAASPRRYLAAPQRNGPPSRAVPSSRILPPSSLDSVPVPPSSVSEARADGESPIPGRPENGARTEEPRPIGREVREDKPPADRIPEPAFREDAPSENVPPAQAKPRLRLSIDQPPVWRVPIGDEPALDQGPPANGAAEPETKHDGPATGPVIGDEDAAPIRLRVGPPGVGELPRPQVFSDEPVPQDSPPRELPVQEPPVQDPPEDNPAAGQPSRSIAERIEMAREGDQPQEPEGEDAQVTDSAPPGEAVLQDDAPVANPSSVAAADPRPAADNRGPVELRLAPSRPAIAPVGERIRVVVGPPGEAPAGGKSAPGAASSPSSTPGPKPIRVSLKFPASKSAPPPEALRVRKPGPAGAAKGASPRPDASIRRPGAEPVIVAKLGAGAGSVKRTSPAPDGARSNTADKAAGTGLRPIHLTIKGSTVISQSGGEATPEKTPPASSQPKADSKGGGASAKEKSASAGSASPDPVRHAARAAARLNQWSLFGAKLGSSAPPEAVAPRLLEASRPSTASLR